MTNDRKYCGIDVGKNKSHLAIIRGRDVFELSEFDDENLPNCYACGVDAPLNFPNNDESMRDCETALRKMGIGIYPSGADFFRPIVERGIEIAELMSEKSIVYEVYPFASRKILDIAPKAKKQTKAERKKITKNLRRYVDIEPGFSHDELDAIIGALTVKMYCEGDGLEVGNGVGVIILPKPEGFQKLDKWLEGSGNA